MQRAHHHIGKGGPNFGVDLTQWRGWVLHVHAGHHDIAIRVKGDPSTQHVVGHHAQ